MKALVLLPAKVAAEKYPGKSAQPQRDFFLMNDSLMEEVDRFHTP